MTPYEIDPDSSLTPRNIDEPPPWPASLVAGIAEIELRCVRIVELDPRSLPAAAVRKQGSYAGSEPPASRRTG